MIGCFKYFSDVAQCESKKLYLVLKEVFALSYNACQEFCIRTLKCKIMRSVGGECSTNHSLFSACTYKVLTIQKLLC